MINKVPPGSKLSPTQKTWLYLNRTARLRCPECGISPLFPPASQVESISDWFTMLPGCPRCGYAYFFTLIPLWLLGILSTRHTKAFFLALDHLLSPHLKDPD